MRRQKKYSINSWEVSQSLALVFVGDLNLPEVYWKYDTGERKQSRKLLECVEDNFLTQLVREPARGSAWLNQSADLANQGGPSGLEVSKCGAHLQEGPETGSGEMRCLSS